MREVVRGDKHNLRKSANRNAQISVIHSAHYTDLCFAICRFSQVVCHLEQLHAQSPFLFPMVFSINLIPFFDNYLLSPCCSFTPVVLACAALLGPPRGCNSCCLWFWQLVFGVSLWDGMSNLPSSPTPSQTEVCSTMEESIRPSSFHNPTPSANKHVVQICRSSLSAAVQTVQVNVEPHLSTALKDRSVMPLYINTKSLPVSATTFPTALSLYIAHDGRKHKQNPTLSANKHVVQICRSSLSAAADGLADGSGERRTSLVNGIERSLSRAVQ